MVDLEANLSISFKQEYLEGLEGFKLILFVWKYNVLLSVK